MTIVLATRNKGKISELRRLLDGWHVESCDVYPGCPVPDETGHTFQENALIKARIIASFTQEVTLADDSGLEVDALDGAPGIYSARFAGLNASDEDNRRKILHLLTAIPDAERKARFRCVIAISTPDGKEWISEGACEGHIGRQEMGKDGFGYDPLFIPDGYKQTFAELGKEIKNQISHRSRALQQIMDILQSITG
ncbi:MAG: XTP/dITP diphosphatase [Gemmatimonadota bacterium]|nr:XTP/dITP diphosphatase [Gemmatimonadota bacterium]